MIVYVLVGLPGSGKSTWRSTITNHYCASSDDFIEAMAKDQGKTYDQVFKEQIKGGEKHCTAIIGMAVRDRKPLVVDRTNLTIESRRRILARIPFDWERIAVVFRPLCEKDWMERLASRPGKTIPESVLNDMKRRFETPSLDEGFSSILEYST